MHHSLRFLIALVLLFQTIQAEEPLEISIGQYKIGPQHPPFIIAKLTVNHQGSLKHALELVEAAKAAGAHAIKLQTYTPDTITLDVKEGKFLITDTNSPWYGKSLYDLYEETYTPWEWHKPIFERCKELGLIAFSTPFDETAVEFLEMMNVPCYKISSLDIINHPLIQKVAATGKPVVLSTGGASMSEIGDAVAVARKAGCKNLILMKCTSAYPVVPSPTVTTDSNLRTIPHLMDSFKTLVGLSDYTTSLGAPIASVALGCCLIEKPLSIPHPTVTAQPFQLDPHDFSILVEETKKAWEALGKISYGPVPSEKICLSFRPSLHFVQDLHAGEMIELSHVRAVRPAGGLPPKELDKIIGLQLKQAVKKGTPVTWSMFKE